MLGRGSPPGSGLIALRESMPSTRLRESRQPPTSRRHHGPRPCSMLTPNAALLKQRLSRAA
jgi:hypothetical protein